MYKVQEVAKLTGLSKRTLRYYDDIKLLEVSKLNNGYRIYHDEDLEVLSLIMMYRELDFKLSDIKEILKGKSKSDLLHKQKEILDKKIERYQNLSKTIDLMIKDTKGEVKMSNQKRFEAFKKDMIDQNEKEYGKDAKEMYGAKYQETVVHVKKMTEKDFNNQKELEQKSLNLFIEAMEANLDVGTSAKEAIRLHGLWLKGYWGYYNPESHKGLINNYTIDEKFSAYYDKFKPGLAKFMNQVALKLL